MRLSGLRGGSRKSEMDAELGCPAAVLRLFLLSAFQQLRKALAVKLHDKINGCAALALAVPVPVVSPDGQAVVPLPAVLLSGAGKLLAPSLQKRNKVGLVGAVYLFLGVIHG